MEKGIRQIMHKCITRFQSVTCLTTKKSISLIIQRLRHEKKIEVDSLCHGGKLLHTNYQVFLVL